MSSSIKDKVVIIGMGCSKFGENWAQSADDMIIEAAYEAFEDAGISPKDIQAAFVGTLLGGLTAATLTEPLQLDYIPVTRVENNCASGADAFRCGCLAVASGLYDYVLVVGYEKCKDSGVGFLTMPYGHHPVYASGPAPGSYAMAALRYFHKYGINPEEGKKILAKIAVKNHQNGALSPKAHFRQKVTLEQVMKAPIMAWPLGLYDCCPTTDGAAAAILVRSDLAPNFRKDYILVKGLGLAIGRVNNYRGKARSDVDLTFWEETWMAAQQAYQQAGVTNPRQEISLAEVHDCFTITELINYESLGFSHRGKAKEDVEAGTFALEGELPVNPDGGLKAFGHPIGASGIRMIYELYKQMQGKAGPRQIKNPELGLAHAQGGAPGAFQASVVIVGTP